MFSKLGVDVELKEFKLMPHGFLNYNFPIMGMKEESMEGIKTGSKWLSELSESDPKKVDVSKIKHSTSVNQDLYDDKIDYE